MKLFWRKRYLFKECKKCSVKEKKQKVVTIISPCQKCIEHGEAHPPQSMNIKTKYNK